MSIFDLKTNVSELSSVNNGVSRMAYEQSPPTRDVSGVNFPNGQISFRWETSGTRWWIPSRSYLRMRFTLKNAAGNALLTQSNNIAPNMNLMATLFQSLEMRVNDKTISRVSDFVSQIDSLQTRVSKSKSWLSGVGNSANFWNSQFKLRQVDVTQDGKVLPYTEDKTTLTTGLVGGAFGVIAATGVCTFAADQSANPWLVGDVLEYTVGANTYKLNVLSVTSATVLNVHPLPLADGPAVAAYNRSRKSPYTEDARNLSTFELIWTPCLSVYQLPNALPCGRYELILTPQSSTSYQRYAVESLVAKTPDTDYQFRVVDMYHYTNTCEGPRCDDMTYFLDLTNVSCQSEAQGLTNSFIQKNFDVSPSTNSLVVAYQDTRCGTDTRFSPTKFRAYNAAGNASVELGLDRLMLQYDGASYPSPDAQLTYVAGTDYTTQRYLDSLLYSGQFFDTGGSESIEEFHERGSYYYFSTPKDGTSRSTRVTVHSGFGNSNGADLGNMRLLLFSISKQVARIKIENSRVVDVQIEDS